MWWNLDLVKGLRVGKYKIWDWNNKNKKNYFNKRENVRIDEKVTSRKINITRKVVKLIN